MAHTREIAVLSSTSRRTLWVAFFLYLLVAAVTMAHHEPWGDELHSWNIAKASSSIADLLHNKQYEGHPPAWYLILWCISRFSHTFAFVQAFHLAIAVLTVFLLLFASPLPISSRLLIPFGYFLLFEYAILSRNYALGILPALLICIILTTRPGPSLPLYYALLLIMSNAHLLSFLLAACLHLYFLASICLKPGVRAPLILHSLLGFAVLLPGAYFMFPPSDSQLNLRYWADRWSVDQLKTLAETPLRAFVPIPAWWQSHFWNTHFVLDAQAWRVPKTLLTVTTSAGALGLAVYILKDSRRCLTLFLANLSLSFLIASLFFPLARARYAGFLFIGFVVAYWLLCRERAVTDSKTALLNVILTLQLIAGAFCVRQDIRFPFSNASRVSRLLTSVPGHQTIVTDYWTLNALAAFTDRPYFCIDLGTRRSFIGWTGELAKLQKKQNRYSDGIDAFFANTGLSTVVMISSRAQQDLLDLDPALSTSFQLRLLDKLEGAIEKEGNLYLYEIRALPH